MKYLNKVNWTDPKGVDHVAGDVDEIDPSVVFDLDDLIRIGTLEKAPIVVDIHARVSDDGSVNIIDFKPRKGKPAAESENF